MPNIIAFDFETGGLLYKKNPITEVAMIALDPEKDMLELGRIQFYVKPYNFLELDQKALDATGVTREKIEKLGVDGKVAYQRIKDFLLKYHKPKFPKKPILAGHNIQDFDLDFGDLLFKVNDDEFGNYYSGTLDTLKMAYLHWAGDNKRFNLASCCERIGYELSTKDAHNAFPDTEAAIALLKYFRNPSGVQNTVVQKSFYKKPEMRKRTFQF